MPRITGAAENSDRTPGDRPARPHRADRLAALVLVLLCLSIYGQTLRFGFVAIDDPVYVTENEAVQGGLSPQSIRWAFSPAANASNWHPLTWLSLMLDATLFGGWAGGFHLTNILLHALNSVLVYALFRGVTGRRGCSFVTAALFAVHPLHVESVAWISERKDLLSALFGLLALWLYSAFVGSGRPRWYALSAAGLLCSLMSKQMLVTLPCLLLLWDYWPWKRVAGLIPQGPPNFAPTRTPRTIAALLLEKLPFFGLSLIFSAVAIAAQTAGGATQGLDQFPLGLRLSNAAASYVVYLRKTIWPFDLAVFYPYPYQGLPVIEVLSCTLLLGAITAFALFHWRRQPWLAVGWSWYLITLLPVIGIVQVGDQAYADRYTYLPLLGIFLAVTWQTADILSLWKCRFPVAGLLCAATILTFTAISWNQAHCWKDSITLFEHALSVTRDNWVAEASLGAALLSRPEQAENAERHLRRALQLQPLSAMAHYNLALLLSDRQQLEEANSEFRQALALDPNHLEARLYLCMNLKRLGAEQELARELQKLKLRAASFPPELRTAIEALSR